METTNTSQPESMHQHCANCVDGNHCEHKGMFSAFFCSHWSMLVGALSLVVVLLPGIVQKISVAGETAAVPVTPSFDLASLFVGFLLALWALGAGRNNPSARAVAILTLVVCIIRFVSVV